jgi:hypothetical protein
MVFITLRILIIAAISMFSPFGCKKADNAKIKPDSAGVNAKTAAHGTVTIKNMFGINSYEWNFLQNPAAPNEHSTIYEANMSVINSFSAVRHYMEWKKLERTKGNYTFNPTNDGGWNYDLIYTRCKQNGILVVADLKDCPEWILNTYPEGLRDAENVPAVYGLNRSEPATYKDQAKVAFQFAARYGYHVVDKKLIKVDTRPRWTNDPPNEAKTGMQLIKYIECDNERDKWWKSAATKQTPEEYAANMSAFYDGDKGKLGPDAGVKNADPNMKVLIGGLASADVNYVKRMVEWCRKNRGLRPDGSVDLCFDIINYHLYSNDGNATNSEATTGIAPELSTAATVADGFVTYAKSLKQHPEVWVTETGYDINQGSRQKAIPINKKDVLMTQADWIIRSAFLYSRHGVNRLFFYQLQDDQPGGTNQYATSGLSENAKRRPAADYILQVSKLMGDYSYTETINADPLVYKYTLGNKNIYILTIPDQKDRKASYVLNLGKAKKAYLYSLKAGSDKMEQTMLNCTNGKVSVNVTETPVFVTPL